MERKLKSFITLSLIIIAFMMCFAIMQTDAAHADAVPVMTYFGKSITAPYFSGYWYQIDVGSRFKGAEKVTIFVGQDNAPSNRVAQKCGGKIVSESTYKKRGTDIIMKDYKYEIVL